MNLDRINYKIARQRGLLIFELLIRSGLCQKEKI